MVVEHLKPQSFALISTCECEIWSHANSRQLSIVLNSFIIDFLHVELWCTISFCIEIENEKKSFFHSLWSRDHTAEWNAAKSVLQ